MATVLIVDDDQRLLRMLERMLSYENLDVTTATNGRQALDRIREHRPDIVILDWLMPELNGIEVVTRLRAHNDQTPVLMLTARDAVENRVQGLESGADDYLVKPFAPVELVARVHALLRRTRATDRENPLRYADLLLDPVTRRGRRGERGFELTPTEFSLLRYLMRHPRQVLHREQMLSTVWGVDFFGDDNVLEVYIGYLRRKTESGGESRLIQTVRGIGYVLRD